MNGSVVVLELNELTPNLMDRFIAEGHLPGFAKLRDQSIECVTDAEEQGPTLEPWIQWITVHTGLSYAEHGVFDLGDGPRLDAPRIWDHVADAGERAWVCGSMNAAARSARTDNLHLLPDPWSIDVAPHPEPVFRDYFHFVRTQVQEYTRTDVPLTRSDYLRFGRFMVRHGLSSRTVLQTLRQLASERTGPHRWRRASLLDRLQWDTFRHFYKKLEPRLSTFFLNSTAHFQHYHWRNLEPTLFKNADSPERQREYADAILFGYQQMDRIVTECLELVSPGTTIVLCTALSQQPLLKYEDTGGKQIYKVNDIAELLRFAEIDASYDYAPVMAEEFTLTFVDDATAEAAEGRLLALCGSDGASAMQVRRTGTKLFCGCAIDAVPPPGLRIGAPGTDRSAAFEEIFYPVEGVKSGMHHPDGILWIRTPARSHIKVDRKVSLRELAPTLLELCDVRTDHEFSCPPMPEISRARA